MKLNWKDKKVTVMGLGLHGGGVAVTRFFARAGAKVTATDLRSEVVLMPSLEKLKGWPIKYVLGRHRVEDFRETDLVVQNPGVPNDSPYLKLARKAGVPIENEAGIFFELVKVPVIGITGTKGKSTVTTLVGEILKKFFPRTIVAGNIRTAAMLDILPKIDKNTKVVLELSSWQLEGLVRRKVSPRYALITNVLPDHLNRYSSFNAYAQAKGIIFRFQKPGDLIVLNYDNRITRKLSNQARSQVIWFSKRPFTSPAARGAFVNEGNIVFGTTKKFQPILPVSGVHLLGEHNLENVLAAVALTRSLKVPDQIISASIRRFKSVGSRLETARRFKGVTFVNDTTATAPIATLAALKALSPGRQIILIAGGQDKGLDYRELGRLIDRLAKSLVLLPGTASKKIRQAVKKTPVHLAKNMNLAVRKAFQLAEPGDTVLLSPAAASFNLFNNEFDRGEKYLQAVKDLT
ncbi:MAG: UDP-N-acetylmuramoyl-L-alanine--D-glutamate ligase [Patescibacteria group bacterium]|nr:UDP-N-acetylmuramoyl-L-alanine--D-glutamate ligase [Patescibacteria group bacterium]